MKEEVGRRKDEGGRMKTGKGEAAASIYIHKERAHRTDSYIHTCSIYSHSPCSHPIKAARSSSTGCGAAFAPPIFSGVSDRITKPVSVRVLHAESVPVAVTL